MAARAWLATSSLHGGSLMKPNYCYCAVFFSALLLSGCSTTKKPDVAMITIPAANPPIATMGRTHTNSDNSLLLGFPGVSIKTEVVGKSLTADLQSSTGNSWIDVIVDDNAPITLKISNQPQTIELFNFAE